MTPVRILGISRNQFERMQERVSGRGRPAPVLPPTSPLHSTRGGHQVLMGIDPSLRGTGFGIIRLGKPGPTMLVQGVIKCPLAWEHSRCLAHICRTLRDLLGQHAPTVCIVEGLFYAQNLQTALTMGQARGAALVAAAEAGCDIYELAPRRVKQAIVGYGAAQKFAVAKMVQRLLRLEEIPGSDAADALALALAWSQESGRFSLSSSKRI